MIKNTYLSLIAIVFLLFSCGGESNQNLDEINDTEEEIPIGGVFTMPIGSYIKEVQVNEIQKLEESQIYTQIFEGLVAYNAKTLEVEPAIAKEWSVSDDGLAYTFVLREDVFFHDNSCFEGGKGRKVTAEDVMYSFEQIYDNKATNSGYSIFKNTVIGGDAFHDGEAETIEGISIDGNQIILKLAVPSLAFIKKMASIFGSVVAKEAVEADAFVPVGTGPFVYDEVNSNSELVKLAKNTNYYGVDEKGTKLPYLDSVVFAYYDDNDEQMDLFWNGELSVMRRVPITKISEVLEERIGDFESKPPKFMLNSEPELITTYLELNMTTPVLKKRKVRQALNFAINRKKIVEKILKNQAYEIGKFGIVPPLPKVFNDYDFEGVEDVSYVYNPQRAKELLAEAGYPEGKNFPSLQMQFKSGSTDYLVASELQSQLRSVLNINLDIEAVEFNQMLENKAMGNADIFRTNWVGDYASPEAFLTNAYGKVVPKKLTEPSYLNSSRYQNSEFDALYEDGAHATSEVKANEFFSAAEKLLMEDAVFIILWYGEDLALEQAFVRDFETNSIGYVDLKKVYFKTPTAAEYESN